MPMKDKEKGDDDANAFHERLREIMQQHHSKNTSVVQTHLTIIALLLTILLACATPWKK